MHVHEQRCGNCSATTTAALCAPCEQDRLLEQAQLAAASTRGLRCFE